MLSTGVAAGVAAGVAVAVAVGTAAVVATTAAAAVSVAAVVVAALATALAAALALEMKVGFEFEFELSELGMRVVEGYNNNMLEDAARNDEIVRVLRTNVGSGDDKHTTREWRKVVSNGPKVVDVGGVVGVVTGGMMDRTKRK